MGRGSRDDVRERRRLLLFVGAVVVDVPVAVESARLLVHAPRSLAPDFVLPLVPIAFAYLVAHYFSLFVIQGQFIYSLISDPFGRGWDLFGTVDFAPNLAPSRRRRCGTSRPRALVVGHVAGLAIAHDRAVALFESRRDALRSQYPMLGLMVLYTVGGLWLSRRGSSRPRRARRSDRRVAPVPDRRAVLIAVWLRERRAGRHGQGTTARLG